MAWLLFRPLLPARLVLTPVPFAALPDWASADAGSALAAFRRSCEVILRQPVSRALGGIGYAGRAGDWEQVCGESARVPFAHARTWFEGKFTAFAVHEGAAHEALFTGYYEPEIAASHIRQANYVTPIFGLPRNLVTADLGQFRPELSGTRITGRVAGNKLVPLPDRAEIDTKGLEDAPVLLYARDPVSAFFLHIQGSGRASFEDGTVIRLAYAGQNGRPYTSVGRVLIQNGAIDHEHMSMQAIRAWLEAHPAEAQHVMESDQSYVFFRELPIGDPKLGSPGSEGVPLTPRASIAIDPAFHPLGVPMFLTTEAPAPNPGQPSHSFACLCITQDTGGAIKGGLRADIFWGYGADAESVAGRMKSVGHFYVLLPNSLASHVPLKVLAPR